MERALDIASLLLKLSGAAVGVAVALRLLFTPDPCIAPGGVVVQLEQPAP